jgi:hypothetical protein
MFINDNTNVTFSKKHAWANAQKACHGQNSGGGEAVIPRPEERYIMYNAIMPSTT